MKISRGRPLLLATLLFLLNGCDALKLGVMNPAGPIAASQWHLYVIVGIVLVFVAGPVLFLTPLIAWHYRLANKHSAFKPEWHFSWTLEGFIWVRRRESASAFYYGIIHTRSIPIARSHPTSRRLSFRRWRSTGNGCLSIRTSGSRPSTR